MPRTPPLRVGVLNLPQGVALVTTAGGAQIDPRDDSRVLNPFVFGFSCLPQAGKVGPSAVRFFTSGLVPWSCPPPPRRPSSPISPCSEHTDIRADPRKGKE